MPSQSGRAIPLGNAQPNSPEVVYAGLDFGTTFSGISYAVPTRFGIPQPSTLLWRAPDGSPGYHIPKIPSKVGVSLADGETRIASWGLGVPEDHCLLEWFKLSLINRDYLPIEVRKSTKLMTEANARVDLELTAVQVTGFFLKNLWEAFLEKCGHDLTRSTVYLTITIPPTWPLEMISQMQKSVQDAGISRYHHSLKVTFLPETEAATLALFPSLDSHLQEGGSVIVCDCGGGTVDTVAYKLSESPSFTLKEILFSDCHMAGSVVLDDQFLNLLKRCAEEQLTAPVFNGLTEGQFIAFANIHWHNFLKHAFDDDTEKWEFSLPADWQSSKQRSSRAASSTAVLSFSKEDLEFITDHVRTIVNVIRSQIRAVERQTGFMPQAIVVSGGYGRNEYLRKKIREGVYDESSDIYFLDDEQDIGWKSVSVGGVYHAITNHQPTQPVDTIPRIVPQLADATYVIQNERNGEETPIATQQNRAILSAIPIEAFKQDKAEDGITMSLTVSRRQSNGDTQPAFRITVQCKEPLLSENNRDEQVMMVFRCDGSFGSIEMTFRGAKLDCQVNSITP